MASIQLCCELCHQLTQSINEMKGMKHRWICGAAYPPSGSKLGCLFFVWSQAFAGACSLATECETQKRAPFAPACQSWLMPEHQTKKWDILGSSGRLSSMGLEMGRMVYRINNLYLINSRDWSTLCCSVNLLEFSTNHCPKQCQGWLSL